MVILKLFFFAKIRLSFSPQSPESPPHTSCLPLCNGGPHFDSIFQREGPNTQDDVENRIIRPPSHLQAPFRGDPGFPAKSAFFSSQLPPSHVPPPNMVHEVGTAWRTNETKRFATLPRLPFLPISGPGRVVTRWMIVSVSEPPPYATF